MGTKAPRQSTETGKSGRLCTAVVTINPGPSEAESSKDGFSSLFHSKGQGEIGGRGRL